MPVSPLQHGSLDVGAAARLLTGDLKKRIDRVRCGKIRPKDVHKLRSGLRRVEAMHATLVPADRLPRKLDQHVRKLRKRAGRVRDCDVSLEILRRELPKGSASNRVARMVRELLRKRRAGAANRLQVQASKHASRKVPHSIKQAAKGVCLDERGMRASLERCLRSIRHRARADVAGSPERLHSLRLAIKRLRDTAVLLSPAMPRVSHLADLAESLADTLGRAQDLVVLTELLDEAAESAAMHDQAPLRTLTAMIEHRRRSMHRQAVRSLGTLNKLAAPHSRQLHSGGRGEQ